jgi:hypothetical protein
MSYRVSVWDDETEVRITQSCGCSYCYLIVYLKMFQMINSVLCIFYNLRKH